MSVISVCGSDPLDHSDSEGSKPEPQPQPYTGVSTPYVGQSQSRKAARHIPKVRSVKAAGQLVPGPCSKQPCAPGCIPKQGGGGAAGHSPVICSPAPTLDKKAKNSKKTVGAPPARKGPEPLAQAIKTAAIALQKARAMMPAVDLQPALAPVWSTELEMWNSLAKPKYQ